MELDAYPASTQDEDSISKASQEYDLVLSSISHELLEVRGSTEMEGRMPSAMTSVTPANFVSTQGKRVSKLEP